MIPICIFGNDDDDILGNMIKTALSPYGEAVYCKGENQVSAGKQRNCDFYITEWTKLPVSFESAGIAVFKKSFLSKHQLQLPAGWIVVMGSHDEKLKEYFCKTGQMVITCGTNATDTFSIASLNENQTAVSLQRTLKTLNGSILEPCEITMHLTQPYNPHKVLPVAAVLLLADIPWDSVFVV